MGSEQNASKSIPAVNCSIIFMASDMSPNQRWGRALKDKHRLALCSLEHLLSQHRPIR